MVPRDDRDAGLSGGAQERLVGVLMIIGGVTGFGAVYLLWLYAPSMMPVPPGLPSNLLPLASPLNCILPGTAIGSCLLVVVGLRKLVFAD